MSADILLDRLDKVRRTGPDSWKACCPGHSDTSPSLSIRELDDGRVLLYCFAGCSAQEIVAAVGLELSSLFPPREINHGKRVSRPFPAADCLRAVGRESLIVAAAVAAVCNGKPLDQVDRDRVMLAASRIQSACNAAGVA